MAHRTFFSFHYERDVWRASNVRMSSQFSQLAAADEEWIEASLWESVKASDAELRKLIDGALTRTSVTAVLIGAETASRRWVDYEINASIATGNGLFGIYIDNIKDTAGNTDRRGVNPLPAGYPVYDWVNNDGRSNLGAWVNTAYDLR